MHKKKAYMARNCGISSSRRLWRQRRQQLPDTNSHSDERLFLSSLPNHHRSSLGRSPPKRIDTCFYSKLEVNLGCIEIVAASTTIKIQMTQDICGGGESSPGKLPRFSAIFRLSSLHVFQNKSTIFRPSAILFTFYMLLLYDVVTFYANTITRTRGWAWTWGCIVVSSCCSVWTGWSVNHV